MEEDILIPTYIRALIWFKEAGHEVTFDLELDACELTTDREVDFKPGPLVRAMPDRITFKGRSKQALMEVGSYRYEQGLVDRFEELWNEWGGMPVGLDSSTSPSRSRQYALNFWLAAHGVGPYAEEGDGS